jgi:hypothetical protein
MLGVWGFDLIKKSCVILYTMIGTKQSFTSGLLNRALGTAIHFGRKVRDIYNNPLVAGIRGALPETFRAPLEAAASIGGELLRGGEALQQNLGMGGELSNRVNKSVEMVRKTTQPEASVRTPALIASGGNRAFAGLESQLFGMGTTNPTFPFGLGATTGMSLLGR